MNNLSTLLMDRLGEKNEERLRRGGERERWEGEGGREEARLKAEEGEE